MLYYKNAHATIIRCEDSVKDVQKQIFVSYFFVQCKYCLLGRKTGACVTFF